jgi:hypothetical protein
MSAPLQEVPLDARAPRPELLGKTVIDVINADGIVRERFRFPQSKSPITIGRSITCDVTIDDPYVAPMHAILEITPSGTARVSDTGSINGIVVGGKQHRSASGVALPDERFRIGRSTVRVRTAEGALPPELVEGKPRKRPFAHPILWATIFGAAVAAHAIYERWRAARSSDRRGGGRAHALLAAWRLDCGLVAAHAHHPRAVAVRAARGHRVRGHPALRTRR